MEMFSELAWEYDRLNRIMSFFQDQKWRARSASLLGSCNLVLDVCAGTGDMSQALCSNSRYRGKIVLCDFSLEMLKVAQAKLVRKNLQKECFLVIADAQRLPFKEKVFCGIMSGFALRNLENLDIFISETKRVLEPNGKAIFLEIAHPENGFWARIFYFYFYKLMPLYIKLFTHKYYAFKYLATSLKNFPSQKKLTQEIFAKHFSKAEYKNFLGGVASIYKLNN